MSDLDESTIFISIYGFYCKITGLNHDRTLGWLLTHLLNENELFSEDFKHLSDKVNKLRAKTDLRIFYRLMEAFELSLYDDTVGKLSEKLEKRLNEWINQLN